MKRSLHQSEPVWHGLLRLVQADFSRVAESVADPGTQADQVIHGLRLSTKRLRATWRLLGPHLDAARVSLENARLREAAHALAAQRDRVIAAATLRSLMDDADAQQRRVLRRCLGLLHAQVPAEPAFPPPAAVSAALPPGIPPVAMALGALRESANALCRSPMPRTEGWDLLEPGLRKSYAHARQGWRQVRCAKTMHCPDGESLCHDWRRDVKRLLYQLEPVCGAWPRRLKPMLRRLARLGECLGDHHDLQVVQTLLNHDPILSRLPGLATVPPLLTRRQHRLYARALRRARRCLRTRPKAWAMDLGDHFKQWHRAPHGIL